MENLNSQVASSQLYPNHYHNDSLGMRKAKAYPSGVGLQNKQARLEGNKILYPKGAGMNKN
jgi:hypothetical protein